jgi:hypothetical protein
MKKTIRIHLPTLHFKTFLKILRQFLAGYTQGAVNPFHADDDGCDRPWVTAIMRTNLPPIAMMVVFIELPRRLPA